MFYCWGCTLLRSVGVSPFSDRIVPSQIVWLYSGNSINLQSIKIVLHELRCFCSTFVKKYLWLLLSNHVKRETLKFEPKILRLGGGDGSDLKLMLIILNFATTTLHFNLFD